MVIHATGGIRPIFWDNAAWIEESLFGVAFCLVCVLIYLNKPLRTACDFRTFIVSFRLLATQAVYFVDL